MASSPATSDPETLQSLARACVQKEWSKAIKFLSSLLSKHPDSVSLLCNRAFCHNKLELHKHAIKDCDRALRLDTMAFKAYIYKGHAFVALGKHQDALKVWRQGYEGVMLYSGNIELLLELDMLVKSVQKEHVPIGAVDTNSVVTTNAQASCSPPKTPPRTSMQIEKHSRTSKMGNDQKSTEPKRASRLISLDLRLSRGISQVNDGKYEQAVATFDQVIKDNPNSMEALLGRGTAYAFQRNLEVAIKDFSQAIQINPSSGEAWKRRGQARAALGQSIEAILDLTKALEIKPDSSDILHERGLVHFKLKDFESTIKDLRACVAMDSTNKPAYNYLGLALISTGQYPEGIDSHHKAIELDPNFKEGWTQLAQSYQELGKIDKAMECLQKALNIDIKFVNAYRLIGLLRHGLGDHKGAVKDLSMGLEVDPCNLECKYLRASCHQAIGDYADAVKDYDAVLSMEIDSHEKSTLQYLAFYQRELALYTASKANSAFSRFDIDDDLHPMWKEAWCKRSRPNVLIASLCSQPPVKVSLKNGRLRSQDLLFTKAKRTLLEVADRLGSKIQYSCRGFLKNKRQHRMAGLAALEIAQKVANTWRAIRESWTSLDQGGGPKVGKRAKRKDNTGVISHNRGGVCSSSSSEDVPSCSCHEEKSSSPRLIMKWQDVYSIAVKWRQASEPCDPVVWVNKLSDEEFNAGFGSHTPILQGQAKVVRYYPNFSRAFSIAKELMFERKVVYNAANEEIHFTSPEKLESIEAAKSCLDLYNVVGEDFWIVTHCSSTAFEGKFLDGTRLTMQKIRENGFDFSIRTPGTPPRWADYDSELSAAWEALCEAFCGEVYGSSDLRQLEKIEDYILRLTFYWYNFMPLARGTAAVGYVVLLGLFLAAGMEISTSIPEGIQVDWEAILSPDVNSFIQAVHPWMYPSVKADTSWQNLPDITSTFPTTGSVIAALSTYE